MPTSLIHQHDRLRVGGDGERYLDQVKRPCFGVAEGQDQPGPLALFRADRAKDRGQFRPRIFLAPMAAPARTAPPVGYAALRGHPGSAPTSHPGTRSIRRRGAAHFARSRRRRGGAGFPPPSGPLPSATIRGIETWLGAEASPSTSCAKAAAPTSDRPSGRGNQPRSHLRLQGHMISVEQLGGCLLSGFARFAGWVFRLDGDCRSFLAFLWPRSSRRLSLAPP